TASAGGARRRDGIGKRQRGKSRTVRRTKARVAPFSGGDLHHGEKIAATAGGRCRIDDGATGLSLEGGTVDPVAGRHVARLDVEEIRPFLEAAQVLCAGDDLLTRVAAFLKVDASENVQVRCLRDKCI